MQRSIWIGQISLIVCCGFYVLWWSLCYRPNVVVNRIGGLYGLLLLVVAFSGFFGVGMTIYGQGTLPSYISGNWILIGGIVTYLLLLFITQSFFGRPVTTELILIVGWTLLEMSLINHLYGAQMLSSTSVWIALIVCMLAFIISIVLYVLYYRMEPQLAYYAAMAPLLTEAVSMIVLLILK